MIAGQTRDVRVSWKVAVESNRSRRLVEIYDAAPAATRAAMVNGVLKGGWHELNRWTALHDACWKMFDRCTKVLVEHCRADVNVRTEVRHARDALGESATRTGAQNGTTPLGFAAASGSIECVRMLLSDVKIDVNAANLDGWTPLHFAIFNTHAEVVKLLLAKGASISAATMVDMYRYPAGTTCFEMAKKKNRSDIFLLVKAAALQASMVTAAAGQVTHVTDDAAQVTSASGDESKDSNEGQHQVEEDQTQDDPLVQGLYSELQRAVTRNDVADLGDIVCRLAEFNESKRLAAAEPLIQQELQRLQATLVAKTGEANDLGDEIASIEVHLATSRQALRLADRRGDTEEAAQVARRIQVLQEQVARLVDQERRVSQQIGSCRDALADLSGQRAIGCPTETTPSLALLQSSGLFVSRNLNDFEIIKSISARHEVLQARLRGSEVDHYVALKRVPLDSVKELRREVLVSSRIRHPCLLPLQAVFADGPYAYLQSPWCGGSNLRAWLQHSHSMAEAHCVLREVSRGLFALHSIGIVHGDVKPENILLSDCGQPLLADFGFSRDSSGLAVTASLSTAAAAGYTRSYAAPELLETGRNSFASDMFAFGVVMREVLDQCRVEQAADKVMQEQLELLCRQLTKRSARLRPTISVVINHATLRDTTSHMLEQWKLASHALTQHVQWAVRKMDGTWAVYDSSVNATLESAYINYLDRSEHKDDRNRVWIPKSPTELACVVLTSMEEESAGECRRPVRRLTTREYPYPSQWQTHAGSVMTVALAPSSDEYATVRNLFSSSFADATLVSITRIQNRFQWERYSHERWMMSNHGGGVPLNERMLFHGTSAVPPVAIFGGREGFDFRRSQGLYYGRGAYFAERAAYSHSFAHKQEDGVFSVLVARVLCGRSKDYGKTKVPELVAPPPCEDNLCQLYDSVCGGPWKSNAPDSLSKMFVVYDLAKSYPEYLVCYRVVRPEVVE